MVNIVLNLYKIYHSTVFIFYSLLMKSLLSQNQ